MSQTSIEEKLILTLVLSVIKNAANNKNAYFRLSKAETGEKVVENSSGRSVSTIPTAETGAALVLGDQPEGQPVRQNSQVLDGDGQREQVERIVVRGNTFWMRNFVKIRSQ